jgi:transcription-repair coupling factor (superfamily II helicase)
MTTKTIIHGVPEGQDAFFLKEHAIEAQRIGAVALHVAMDDARAQTVMDLMGFFAPEIDVIYFPAWDCLPYDRVSPNTQIVGQRMQALGLLNARLQNDIKKPCVVLTTVNAITRKIVPPQALSRLGGFNITVGGRLNQADLVQFLSLNGYERTDTVRDSGEFAIRGGIIDIWPATFESPARIDLFGDDIETIKNFDALTQKSEGKLDSLHLNAATEIPMDESSIQRFRSKYRELFGAVNSVDPLYEAISEGRRINGVEHWQSLFFDEMVSLLTYTPAALISLDHQGTQALKEAEDQILDFYQARVGLAKQTAESNKKNKTSQQSIYHPVPVDMMFAIDVLKGLGYSELSPFPSADAEAKQGRDFADIRALPEGDVFAELKKYIANPSPDDAFAPSPSPLGEGKQGKAEQGEGYRKAIINAYSDGSRDRLKGLLEAHHIDSIKICANFDEAIKLKSGSIALITLALERGFINDRVVVITEQDILGDRLIRKSKSRKRKSDVFLREVSSLNAGDYVVHIDHGIGRFEGLETLDVHGVKHDCVKLVYDGGDKLFVPVENIEVLSRYGDADSIASLDKLGGAGWQARRAKVKKNLLEMAGKLIEIAAARALQKADIFNIDSGIYNDFSARFPYHETDDQQSSIDAVLDDLQSGRPMDRLVCGDVGFGKTEVAIRAAYVTAMAGGQVAIIAPTTLLARQHYENFKNRFQGIPLRLGHLSRLVSAKDAKLVKDELEKGTLNIIIGTHALLAESLKFNHLGLVIVDEEQRFGVKQKERLKDLKKDVHVLTLTATPIPRTLQMALTGVRDMSLITTPPVDRLAIRSFVMPFDPLVVREALLREHHRGGQSFIVCPRVKDLQDMEDKIKELVPEVKLVTAHGQLSPTDLEDRMTAFYEKQYDVLLATNIIESGIDVPSANTMIVHRSDMFGLAQLYQIRGRIGRSKTRAYAYLTYEGDRKLTEIAMKRLEIIGMLDSLGAGFQLASHDMDIRGAGNLVGEQQSGHIREVGVELYQQMLEEAVAQAKFKGSDNKTKTDELNLEQDLSPEINLGISVMIPEKYVEDLSVRMGLYRRIATLGDSSEIESFAAELIDRFGAIPNEVENLLKLITIKQICKSANISHLEAGPKGVMITYHDNTPKNPLALMKFIQDKAGTVKLRPDQKLFFPRVWGNEAQRMMGVKSIVNELNCL